MASTSIMNSGDLRRCPSSEWRSCGSGPNTRADTSIISSTPASSVTGTRPPPPATPPRCLPGVARHERLGVLRDEARGDQPLAQVGRLVVAVGLPLELLTEAGDG